MRLLERLLTSATARASQRRSPRNRQAVIGPASARVSAARLRRNRGTVAIVTGQQAGLFGGPFFTLLKAVTAIRLANRVTREHGVPAVPIFWIDAEDPTGTK